MCFGRIPRTSASWLQSWWVRSWDHEGWAGQCGGSFFVPPVSLLGSAAQGPWPNQLAHQPVLTDLLYVHLACLDGEGNWMSSYSFRLRSCAFSSSSTAISDWFGHIWGPQDIQHKECSMVQNSEAHLPGQLCRESPGKEWISWELLLLDSMLLSENQGNM